MRLREALQRVTMKPPSLSPEMVASPGSSISVVSPWQGTVEDLRAAAVAEWAEPRAAVAQEGDVFLEAEAVVVDQAGVGRADVAEVPWLGGNAGDGLLAVLVALNEAVAGGHAAEAAARAVVRKRRADEVDAAGGAAEVDGEAGLVLAAAGQGDVAAG